MPPRHSRSPIRRALVISALAATVVVGGMQVLSARDNPVPVSARAHRVTPGNFTGYGFDQCLAPTSEQMDVWMDHSPFTAVGIYISGNSRACRNQPNLTPEWITHQLENRWRLLPITLGPQASCLSRFPRYDDDPTINPDSTDGYAKARAQGRAEAAKTVKAAKALTIAPGSTMWYDLEGFDVSNDRCRESALRFLHAWTRALHDLGFKSGVYSSAGSGIKMLDDARMTRGNRITLPDYIWIARWDGVADTSTSYISEDGWRPGGRLKQYQGGHNETWGGVTINIDRNFLDLGKGSRERRPVTLCDNVNVDLERYPAISATSGSPEAVKALQCLLRRAELYDGRINGVYNERTVAAANTWQQQHGSATSPSWRRTDWVQLLSDGRYRPLKFGMSGAVVRRLQRALVAANQQGISHSGLFMSGTQEMVRAWQQRVGLPVTGVMNPRSWEVLRNGRWR